MIGMWYIAVGWAADWMVCGTLAGVGGIVASLLTGIGIWRLTKKDVSFGKAKVWAGLLMLLAIGSIMGDRSISFEDPLDQVLLPICHSVNGILWLGVFRSLRIAACKSADSTQMEMKKEKMISREKTCLAVTICRLFFVLLTSYQIIDGERQMKELSLLILGFSIGVLVTQAGYLMDLIQLWNDHECPQGWKLTSRGMRKATAVAAVLSLTMAFGLSDSRTKELITQNTFDQIHGVSLTLSQGDEILAWDTPELWGNATWNLWNEYRNLPADAEIAGDYPEFRQLLISLQRLKWNDPRREEIVQTIASFQWSYNTYRPGLWLVKYNGTEYVENPEELIQMVEYLNELE